MTANERRHRLDPRRSRVERGHKRRGAVAVIVALLLVVFVGFTAFAIDFGQTFVFRAQLQTAADAAAMAGALEVLHARPIHATDSAKTFASRNKVADTLAVADTVIPGIFSDETGTFTPLGDWTDPQVNAVRASTVYEAPYTFARVLGFDTRSVRASAVGVIGSYNSSECVVPWAIPYTNLLWTIGKPYQTNDDLDYDLTKEDIDALMAATMAKGIEFKLGPQTAKDTGSTVINTKEKLPGNYYAVRFPPVEYADGSPGEPKGDPGGNTYKQRIASCSKDLISVGDWIQSEQGGMNGPTQQGVKERCGSNISVANPCKIVAPIYSVKRDGASLPEFKIKYIGAFAITKITGNAEVSGYFTGMAAGGGGFTTYPGPVMGAVLAQ